MTFVVGLILVLAVVVNLFGLMPVLWGICALFVLLALVLVTDYLDSLRICMKCGNQFALTLEEEKDVREKKVQGPTKCPQCRANALGPLPVPTWVPASPTSTPSQTPPTPEDRSISPEAQIHSGDVVQVCSACSNEFSIGRAERQELRFQGKRLPLTCWKCRATKTSTTLSRTQTVDQPVNKTDVRPIRNSEPAPAQRGGANRTANDEFVTNRSEPSAKPEAKVVAPTLVKSQVLEKKSPLELMGPRHVLLSDLRELFTTAFAPIEPRQRTIREWIDNVDVQLKQLQDKFGACEQANKLIQQRTQLVQNLKTMVMAVGDLEHVDLQTKAQLQNAQHELQKLAVEQLRLEIEQQKLEETIALNRALKDARLETVRLEELRNQFRLYEEMQPPEPTPVDDTDPLQKEVDDLRRAVRTRAQAKQGVALDFLTQARDAFNRAVPDADKKLAIEAVLDGYRKSRDELPKEIREFLDQFDAEEVA